MDMLKIQFSVRDWFHSLSEISIFLCQSWIEGVPRNNRSVLHILHINVLVSWYPSLHTFRAKWILVNWLNYYCFQSRFEDGLQQTPPLQRGHQADITPTPASPGAVGLCNSKTNKKHQDNLDLPLLENHWPK